MILRLAFLAVAAEATFLVMPDRIGKLDIKLPLHSLASYSNAAAGIESAAADSAAAGPILGCTTSSFTVPSWFVSDFAFNVTDNSAMFSLVNRANNYTADLGCANVTVTSSTPADLYAHCQVLVDDGHGGVVGSLSDKSVLALVRVRNATTANILLRQAWDCSDRNLSRP